MVSEDIIKRTVENRITSIYNNIRNAKYHFSRNNIPKAKSFLLDVRLDAQSVCRWIEGL